MISVFEYCSSKSGFGHTLKLKEDDVVAEDATCIICKKSAIGSPTFICIISHDDLDCRNVYLHKSCGELSTHLQIHGDPLRLKEEDEDIGEGAACHVCNIPIVAGSPTYTCIRDTNIVCQNFYLHKSCAEFPLEISHHKHSKHSLALQSRPGSRCNVCGALPLNVTYACADCDFDVCVFCAFEQRVLHHEGHQEHTLTLMPREALFTCDACYEEAKDSSYVCTTCDFWIHKSCALSPSTIAAPTYHHHPLNLIYSIPDMHRYFQRFCNICNNIVHTNFWLYYCHKCTYFVHVKCATSSIILNDIKADDDVDNEPDLVQFPLSSEESLFDLITTQYTKFQVDFQSEGENDPTISTIPNDQHKIITYCCYQNHPLEQLHFTISEIDDDENDVDPIVLICDGCIQPITVSHLSYYGCIQCGFFCHSFCMKLPQKLPVGASPFHPQHPLYLWRNTSGFRLVICDACSNYTNGFFYVCETCKIIVDIRCAFFPTRIKHISHKHHTLVQHPFSKSLCCIFKIPITDGVEYRCETCSDFQICMACAFLPSMMRHRYDDHPITLRLPPFFYEGVFYCEICEEQVNNQLSLYHCDESDYSFHYECFNFPGNIKFGGTIELAIENRSHTFTFVFKRRRRDGVRYTCCNCEDSYYSGVLFECYGCGYVVCKECVNKLFSECLPE